MNEDKMIYGSEETAIEVPVSFAYGTIAQAAADTYPGGIAFGYDSEVNAGAIYRMGKLVTSRVIDIVLADDSDNEGIKNVTVKYIDIDGVVRDREFKTVDETLINKLLENKGTIYTNGDYIDIDEDNKISVKYDELYSKVKDDLASAGIGDETSVNEMQSERILAIENGYVSDIEVSTVVGEEMSTMTVSVTSRNSEGAEFVVEQQEISVANEKYYERIDGSLADFGEKLGNVDSSLSSLDAKIKEVENKIPSGEGEESAKSLEWLDVEKLLLEDGE